MEAQKELELPQPKDERSQSLILESMKQFFQHKLAVIGSVIVFYF